MPLSSLSVLTAISVFGTLCGIAYSLFALWCVVSFESRKSKLTGAGRTPPVSILKPLCGVDPQALESLRSHCRQDYPEFEIIFGVSDPNDGIVAVVHRVMSEFPRIPIKLIPCPESHGTNLKVSNLIQMLPQARFDIVLVNDSDIAVPGNYLKEVAAALSSPETGMVTCLYRGIAEKTTGSKLECLGIHSDFFPGVLCARYIERSMRFALGSTMALSRAALDAIGSFSSVADYLADDYQLGYRVAAAGFRVELADFVVDHHLPPYSFGAFFEHQLRWARAVRSSRPGGYAGMIFTFVIPWSLLNLALVPHTAAAWVLFASAVALRYAVTLSVQTKVLREAHPLRHLWLLPFRDLVAAAVWVWSYTARTVVWRGKRFELVKGKLRY
jgi:ceramide glucosyltransferase